MNIDRIHISNGAIDNPGKPQAADDIQNASGSPLNAANEAERVTDMVEQSTSDRLSQVRDAIEAGTYKVSGEAIARKLMQLHDL